MLEGSLPATISQKMQRCASAISLLRYDIRDVTKLMSWSISPTVYPPRPHADKNRGFAWRPIRHSASFDTKVALVGPFVPFRQVIFWVVILTLRIGVLRDASIEATYYRVSLY